ncbi:unnamed protein product [Moneuplotes crassus]|uniref:Uncharacterized protein n=1 Tax=Euplotes crassus TaxID=5936 RepID=A0AAD1X5U6_EUPCR|nr:unnamed protein product [Moneuplotes crassus]
MIFKVTISICKPLKLNSLKHCLSFYCIRFSIIYSVQFCRHWDIGRSPKYHLIVLQYFIVDSIVNVC